MYKLNKLNVSPCFNRYKKYSDRTATVDPAGGTFLLIAALLLSIELLNDELIEVSFFADCTTRGYTNQHAPRWQNSHAKGFQGS